MSWPIAKLDIEATELRAVNSMAQAAAKTLDLHVLQACNIFNCTPDKATSEMRRLGKLENYFKLYGGRC